MRSRAPIVKADLEANLIQDVKSVQRFELFQSAFADDTVEEREHLFI